MKLKFLLSPLFVLMLSAAGIFSQTVSTLIQGPSTFDDCLTLGPDGNIYASRYSGSVITKITPQGTSSIFASGFNSPNGTAFGPDGYLYVPSAVGNRIDKVSPAGTVTNVVPYMPGASAILFRPDGKMIVACYTPTAINLVELNGSYAPLYTGNGLNGPIGLRYTSTGKLIIGNFNDGKIFSVDTATGVFTQIADLPGSLGFLEIVNDVIYSTGFDVNKIFRTTLTGDTMTVAGTGASGQLNGPALLSTFSRPNGIVKSITGDTLFISDYQTRSLRVLSGITLGLININTVAPERYALGQNYPNPFNPVTNIEFSIPNTSKVKLVIYDVQGRLVETLVDYDLKAGSYITDWNASAFSSGVYFYKLEADGFAETKKMILTK
ncbi:MAG: peptidase S8/S53 subtilisin kexin sedolisin [Chlorobi bacterium OLB5]|nr:MAG: peptidase S8/S53 subtilisin kexin sedolisin [Chlorobi bacterium OLB5]